MSDLKENSIIKNVLMFTYNTTNLAVLKCHQISITLYLKTASLKHTEKPNSSPKPELIKIQESS